MSSVLVVCEVLDGKLKKISREALSIGRRLAEATGGELHAVAGGNDAASVADESGRFGAKKLHALTSPALEQYSTEVVTTAVKQVVDAVRPVIVIIAGTANGRDLAPRLAARLDVGVASDVTSLEWTGGKLRAKRPVYSGKAIATVEIDCVPAIVTTRANAFSLEESGTAAAEVVTHEYAAGESKVKVVEVKVPEAGELSIAEADVIVAGGRGLKEAANFALIRDLAHALKGAVGASRATVDAGWIDHQHQVGQTGRVVSPDLYIAAGISGAIQHLAGMASSKHIIAINKDSEAPIFRIADLGIVGDLFTILPMLTEEVMKAKAT
ncbi:MAG: electron transfer flavoprotein subunit alpha/FixB family protein [Thermoanaerobaculia bacterium]